MGKFDKDLRVGMAICVGGIYGRISRIEPGYHTKETAHAYNTWRRPINRAGIPDDPPVQEGDEYWSKIYYYPICTYNGTTRTSKVELRTTAECCYIAADQSILKLIQRLEKKIENLAKVLQ